MDTQQRSPVPVKRFEAGDHTSVLRDADSTPTGLDTLPDQTQDLLKLAILSLESRIALVDQKAGILVAVTNAIAGAAAWAGHELIGAAPYLQTAGRAIGAGVLLLAGTATVYLLNTIRPTKRLFDVKVDLDRLRDTPGPLLWPSSAATITPTTYIANLNAASTAKELQASHFALSQLLRRKYDRYEIATVLVKATAVLATVGVAALYFVAG